MKTDDLIATLSTNVETVDRWQMSRTLARAVAVGAAVTLGAALIVLGCRPDIRSDAALASLVGKLIFAAMVTVLAFIFLIKVARPGEQRRGWVILVALPFVGIVVASTSLADASAAGWQPMLMGDEWWRCLLAIPIIAVVPFVLAVGAMRQAAPTNFRLAGALVGLLAGGLSAAGYALHCTADSLPFVALWYGGTILLCTLAGALLGPRLLRW
ncbi:MAG: DUF1109 domain-containing protein [Rhodospirillales bacterium]|nr:DUF1109 domain-containing protein [Rhodospirillales bacterium]